jgi:hypothetical protein
VINKKPPTKREIHLTKNRAANMPVNGEEQVLTIDEFKGWRLFFTDLMETSLDINRICAGLLSNNRLDQDGVDQVDSRGHPFVTSKPVETVEE